MTDQMLQKIEYSSLIKKFPWIIQKNQNYIISPDSDGFLSALLLTHYLKGNIVGFYDGKIALIEKNIPAEECIFLDMDVNRQNLKSVGHHMVTYNKKLTNLNFHYTKQCIQPNLLRDFDGKNDFQAKYPFGTIHLLLGILHEAKIVDELEKDAVWPLLFTDGVWNNLFGYTENCIEWINYLKINEKDNVMYPLFCSNDQSFYEIMLGLNDFLRMRDNYNAKGYFNSSEGYHEGGRNKRTGDKLKITNSNGDPINLIKNSSIFDIHEKEKKRIEKFINSISKYVGWKYDPEKWTWNGFRMLKFTKGDFSNTTLNNQSYTKLMEKNPLSMAMTSGTNIEYTLETPDKMK